MSDKMDVKSSLRAHKNHLRNVSEKHQNELEALKLSHQKRKAQLANQQAQDVLQIRNNNQKDLVERAHRHEKTLEKMQESLEEVKEHTQARKKNVERNFQNSLENKKGNFEEKAAMIRNKQDMVLEEVNQKANIELGRLQRQIEAKEQELKQSGRIDLSNQKEKAKTELSMDKQLYFMKKTAAEDKYHQALARQRRENDKLVANQEKKLQKELSNKSDNYDRAINKVKSDGSHKQAVTQANFEKKFQELSQKHEALLSNLENRKHNIIRNLRNEVLKAHKLDSDKSGDPFYTTTSLDPKVIENKDSYTVQLQVDPETAKDIQIDGHKRELTLSLNRRFENTRQEEGAKESVKKVETLTRSFDVEKILDVNSVEKNYENGVLSFKVKHA
ncbi:MAG: hypothetical protein WEB87_02810 [Bacteriovoracaceae bacterium]